MYRPAGSLGDAQAGVRRSQDIYTSLGSSGRRVDVLSPPHTRAYGAAGRTSAFSAPPRAPRELFLRVLRHLRTHDICHPPTLTPGTYAPCRTSRKLSLRS